MHSAEPTVESPVPTSVVLVDPAHAGPPPDAALGPTVVVPRDVIRVPRVKQQTNFSCGNAATLALLRYWKPAEFAQLHESDLYGPLGTTRTEGTEPEPIAAYLRSAAGLEVEYRHGDVSVRELERAVDARQPPMVDLQAWRDVEDPWTDVWDAGHYVIMVGYDAERIFFMDPGRLTPGAYAYMLRSELEDRWHDLAGPRNDRLYRMVIFAHGAFPSGARGEAVGEVATRLG